VVKAWIGLLVCIALAGCGKKSEEPAKTADQVSAEKAATEKRVRENTVWGEQVKALDKAKDVQKSVDTQAAETAKKIDDLAK
jgi:uncharacterized lipoprotein YbaY